jgi:hypothetical protein
VARFLLAEDEEKFLMKEVAAPMVPFQRSKSVRGALLLTAMLLASLLTPRVRAEAMLGEGSEALEHDPSGFLLGVHLIDLHLTLASGDREKSLDVLARINGHLKNLALFDEESKFYLRARGDIDRGKPPSELAEEAARVETSLMESSEGLPLLAFGKWTEAGRLSAMAKSPAFFEGRDNRRFPGWLLRNAQEDLGEDVVPTVKRIRGILDDSDLSKLPYDNLEKQFEVILQHYQREADSASSLGID